MRLLCLQPYAAASHEALLLGWQRHSRHKLSVLSLPGRFFKWRFRQAPIELARQVQARAEAGEAWDALWCTSMLDLAALRGLSPAAAKLPAAVYFHENQLTYPARHTAERDAHFGLTNMTTALAAIASVTRDATDTVPPCVWWNSAYNRDRFLDALQEVLAGMPDYTMPGVVESIRSASAVLYPGIDLVTTNKLNDRSAIAGGLRTPDTSTSESSQPTTSPASGARRSPAIGHTHEAPLLLWAARWEYDKGPERFFAALEELDQRGVRFRLSVVGEEFGRQPACFDQARARFADRIVRWGYQPSRGAYEAALQEADVVVSTSDHEFFGIAVAEAVSAGCMPVLPGALAYPEVWGDTAVYHNGSPAGVADAIEKAVTHRGKPVAHAAERFAWPRVAALYDDAIEALIA